MSEARSVQTPPERDGHYALPVEAWTLDGSRYDPRENTWHIPHLGRHVPFYFGKLIERGLHHFLVTAFKGLMMAKLATHSVRSAYGLHTGLSAFLRHVVDEFGEVSCVRVEHLVSYRAPSSKARLVASSNLHSVIRNWARLGIPGIDPEALTHAVEAKKFSHEPGRPVRLRCTIHGPYTSIEWEGLYKALLASFAAGRVSLNDYALCLLSGSLGARPAQLADLKVGDYRIEAPENGNRHVLSVPRAKLKQQRARSQFTNRELVHEIGLVIAAQTKAVRSLAAECGMDEAHVPLFVDRRGRLTL